MITAPKLDSCAYPDSMYAEELQRGRSTLRFSPPLEAEYSRANLLHSRTLIRIACTLTSGLLLLRGFEQLFAAQWHPLACLNLLLVIGASLCLTVIVWTAAFERKFEPYARVLVPIKNAIIAGQAAAIVGQGQIDMLIVLPLLLIGPFFFLGLRLRTALLSGVMTVAAFITSAVIFELPVAIATRAGAVVILSLIACALAARNLEQRSRTSFLESRLITSLAQSDTLTGTKNRRVFDEHFGALWSQAIDERRSLAVLLIDVDRFKAYNDEYGHQAGDQTLRRVAQALQDFARGPLDVLARYGGEEFAAILYGVDAAQALESADAMRHAIQHLNIAHRGAQDLACVTVSIGVAALRPTSERNLQGALQLADQALYEAKLHGRNRVELRTDNDHRLLVTGVFARSTAHLDARPSATRALNR